MLDKYETSELYDMTFLYMKGFPHEVDRTNPRRVKMIFKGDVRLIKSLLEELWDYNAKVDAMRLMEATTAIKRLLWAGGEYKPGFYAGQSQRNPVDSVVAQIKENETHHHRSPDQQEK